ncbi:MAG: DUF58 domain-containing protein [Gammaproteobacteria bacterium]|nr:DUF58 domain-containing protein [Gammaproteobacteria bacterium]
MTDAIILEQKSTSSQSNRAVSRKRLYIFPTQHGLVFALMLIVMLMGSVNYTNSMAYMLTFLLGSLYIVCMLHTYRNLKGMVLKTNNAKPVFAGEVAEFPLILINRTTTDRHSIVVHPWPKKRIGKRAQYQGAEYTNIVPAEIHKGTMPVMAQSRGRLQPGRLRIYSTYPLGLFRAWSYMYCTSYCLVYPKPEGMPDLPQYSEDPARDHYGEQSGTDDFIGVRQYQPGDSIKNIDWKAMAKEQGVLIKKFSGSGARQLVLHWDHTRHIVDVEKKLSQLALWVIIAEQEGLRYGLELPDKKITIGNGNPHQHQCLKTLADYGN